MATIALAAITPGLFGYAAGAAAAGVGGAVFASALGGVVGSVIDQALLNQIFPPPDVEGPRISDLHFGGIEEGAPGWFGMGRLVRVPCTTIWKSPLDEVKDVTNGGGKGGSGGDFIQYKYFCNVQLELLTAESTRVLKFYADGKTIYNRTPDIDYSASVSFPFSVSKSYTVAIVYNPGTDQNENKYTHYLTITSPSGGPDFSKFVSGKDVIVGGFTDNDNNGTFQCTSSKINASTGVSTVKVKTGVVTTNTTTVPQSDQSGQTAVTLFQDLPKFSKKTMSDISFAYGDPDQQPDALVEAFEGVGEVPAGRGTTTATITHLALLDFGNRLPNTFEALLEVQEYLSVGDAIAILLRRGGFADSEFDVTGVSGELVGYAIRGVQTLAAQLQPLMLAYDVMAHEVDGVLTFFHRGSSTVIAVDENDLGAHGVEGSPEARPFRITTSRELDLPTEVHVKYLDPLKEYQTSDQPQIASTFSHDEIVQLDLPIVMTATEAKAIADRLLWTALANRDRIDLELPPSYLATHESETLTVTSNGEDWRVLLDKVDRGNNFLMKVSGVIEDPNTLTRNVVADDPTGSEEALTYDPGFTAGTLSLAIMDIPALRDEDNEVAGFYWAVALHDNRLRFRGGSLMESVDDGATSQEVGVAAFAATMGSVIDPPSSSVISGVWDRVSVVTVELLNGVLESVEEIDCLNGKNRCVIGSEVVGFATATLVDENTYELTNLIRGLRGTSDAISTHESGEHFVLFEARGVRWHPLPLSSIRTTREYKAVAGGGIPSDFQGIDFSPNGNTLRPFPLANVRSTRDVSNNLEITADRQTRALVRPLSGLPIPLLELRESYEVDIYTPGRVTLLRTISTSSFPVTYSAADQTTDGLTPGDPVEVSGYQISDRVGRGKVLEVAV